MRCSVALLLASLISSVALPVAAQERPFMFSVSTPPAEDRHALVYVDAGWGEDAPGVTESQRAEHRLGVQASLGMKWTLLARVAFSDDGQDLSTSQQGELLYNVVSSTKRKASVGVGGGLRHELAGTNVLLGRVVAGRAIGLWRIDGNALFEKPFADGRDGLDLITSAGVARQLAAAIYAGVEMIGEDLEGFWEVNEAEGGARLLVGPSIRVSPPAGHWQLSAAAGPVIKATRSNSLSDATRSLPASSSQQSFGAKASFSYTF